MVTMTQATLERKAEILVINGRQPEAQAVIAGVSYGPAALDEGAARLDAMRASRARKHELLAEQKAATQAEAQARRAARREIVSLSQTARTLFAADVPTLTALGLLPRYESVVTPAGRKSRRAARRSQSTAEMLKSWRQLVDNARTLDDEAAAQLSAAGWPAERLVEASALIEAYAAADTAQQAAFQAYGEASNLFTADLAALRAWYRRAASLIKIAIKHADPADQAQLRELLGLDL
jgi:hypothetical protein